MSCECEMPAASVAQARVLRVLLAINAAMFVIEGGAGLMARSAGLLADSLDMLADAVVYGIGLYAVGRSLAHKARAALASGVFQLALGCGVVVEVGRHLLYGVEPWSLPMMGVGALALVANLSCLALLARHRDGEVHMRASWIFSSNDVLANLGVIVAGVLVSYSGSAVPDLVIGLFIAAVVVRGGLRIVREARAELAGTGRAAPCQRG